MPDHLFVPCIPRMADGDLCPICTMTRRNQYLGIDPTTLPTGEIALEMVDEAWQYFKPKGEDIYGLLKK